MHDYVFDPSKSPSGIQTYFEQVGKVSGHDYMKFEKGKDGVIVRMTPDQYIQNCVSDIFQSSYESVVDNAVEDYRVHEYANKMKQGSVFPIPYLDYTTHNQEGRHRALAFKEAFGSDEKMPVLVIKPTKTTLDEINQYCKQKYGSLANEFMLGIAVGLGFSESEVYQYLGIKPPKEEPETEEDFDKETAEYFDMSLDEIDSLTPGDYARLVDRYFNELG